MLFNPLRSLFWLFFFGASQEHIPRRRSFRLDAVATICSHQRRCSSVSPNYHCFGETAATSSVNNTHTQQKRQSSWLCLVGKEQLSYSSKSNTHSQTFPKSWVQRDLYTEKMLLSFDIKHLQHPQGTGHLSQPPCEASNPAEWEKDDGGNNNC